MTNVLFVSCYSVDINNSASIELIYYMNLLADSGEFKIHLLTMDFPHNSIYYDDDMHKLVHKDITVHRVGGSILLNKMLPRVLKGSVQKPKIHKSILLKVKNIVLVVDPYTSWVNKAITYFKKELSHIKFDIILGMHEPPSSLICSYRIKNFINKFNANTRLISYFSDPYCEEINRKNRNYIIRKLNYGIEKKIVNESDKFLFVTENNAEYYKSKYGINSDNIELVHRGIDENFYNKFGAEYPVEFLKSKINLLHAGDIVGGIRDVTNFIKALDCISENYEEKFKKLNVSFYGNVNDYNQKELINSKGYINSNSRVSYFKIINLIVNADLLIVFGNKEFSQIPAKIYDYMGTNSYILVILESYEDPLYKFIKDADGVKCVLNDYMEIFKTLMEFIDNFKVCRNFNRNYFNKETTLSKFRNVFYN